MTQRRTRRSALSLLSLAALGATLGVGAGEGAPAPLNPRAIIERMSDRNPTLRSYKARVHVDVRMLNFPYLAPKLDGTSYYKRPDLFLVVFDRVPFYARGFQRIFNDIGSPRAWVKDENVSVNGIAYLDGRETIVLRLTKKIHSDILDHTLAYVDPSDYSLVRMEWYYTSGGVIAMTQTYRTQGMYSFVVQQHATIDIPHVRAVADSSYGTYETNVPVDGAGSAAQ
ncbi:MAG TPA: hypothetical protein VMU38_09410 [Candidatus Binatia bacterium]|nr:hypothetical protein [Candidatus Binatia bacterium]